MYRTLLPLILAMLLALGALRSLAQQFYVTQAGDNLFQIAMRHGTTVEALADANGIAPPYTIHAGTRITLAQPRAPSQRIYIVQPGDNLYRIALQNGTTAEALAAANGIGPPYTVHAGTRLVLVNPSDLDQQYYIVRPGDSLFSIAKRKGITAEALAAANGIEPPYIIHVGNWLTVPAPWCPEDEVMSPAAPAAEEPDPGDPNRCSSNWTDCGDGSSPESACRWQVGWCVANLGLDEAECRARYCGVSGGLPVPEGEPALPEDPPDLVLPLPSPTPIQESKAKPRSEPEPEPPTPQCVLITVTNERGEDQTSAQSQICYKTKCAWGLPVDEGCKALGY